MMQYLEKGWYGEPCPKAGFKIIQSAVWTFRVKVAAKPEATPLANPGEYKEGLWEQDVAEWFIVNPQTGRYLECNLSANGAWWLMAFAHPRERNEALLPELDDINTRFQMRENDWEAELSIPEKCLIQILGEDPWMHNVCFILGEHPKQYLSLNQLASIVPDFHRPEEIKMRI